MARVFLLIAALCPLAFAFSNTIPIVAWSSQNSSVLDFLLSKVPHTASIFDSIVQTDDLCHHSAVVIIDQPGLHASDLRTLSSSSNLARTLASAPSSRQFPYVRNTPTAASLSSVAESISARCNSRLVAFTPGQGGITLDSDLKHVVSIRMPHLEGVASSRKSNMAKHESHFFSELDMIASIFPNHLVIFAGSASPFSKRQTDHSSGSFDDDGPDGGILKRYQLLTPGLIVTLLVSFFIIVPIVLFGIYGLASIQSPMRLEPPKGYNAQTRKNQ